MGAGGETGAAMPGNSAPSKDKRSASCLEDGLLLAIARGEISEPALSHFLSHLEDCLYCCTRSVDLEREQPGDLTGKLRRIMAAAPGLLAAGANSHSRNGHASGGFTTHLQEENLDEWLATLRGLRPAGRQPTFPKGGPGNAQFGNLQILSVLGEGTASVVYKALDPELNRQVALKVLRPDVAARPGMAESFLREARALAGVRDPHLVILHKYSRDPAPHLEMELLKGRTLVEALADSPVAPERAMRLVGEIASGLSRLHAAGLVHRDVKPANIWLDSETPGDRAVLLDLGLVGEDNLSAGTRGYIAPEVNETTAPGPAADIYALGLVLRVMAMGAENGPGTQGKCSPELQPLINRMLRLNPDDRPTARQVVEQVGQWQRDRGATRRTVVRGLALAGATMLGAGLWYLGRGSAPSPVLTVPAPQAAGIQPTRVVDRAFPGLVLKSTNRFGVVNGRHAMLTAKYLALAASEDKPLYSHRSPIETDNFGLFGDRAVFCSVNGELSLVDGKLNPPREVARYKIDQGANRFDPVLGFHVSPGGKLLVFTTKSLWVAVPVAGRYPETPTLLGATPTFANSYTPARLEWAEDEKDILAFMERGGITRTSLGTGVGSMVRLVWAARYTPNGLKIFRPQPGVPGAFGLGTPSGPVGIRGPDLVPPKGDSDAAVPADVFGVNFPMGIRDIHFLDTDHLVVLTTGVDNPLRVANVSEREPVWYTLAAREPLAIHTEPDKATLHCLGQDGSVRVWTLPDIQSQIRAGKTGARVAKNTR